MKNYEIVLKTEIYTHDSVVIKYRKKYKTNWLDKIFGLHWHTIHFAKYDAYLDGITTEPLTITFNPQNTEFVREEFHKYCQVFKTNKDIDIFYNESLIKAFNKNINHDSNILLTNE